MLGELTIDTVIRKLVPAANSQCNASLNSVVGPINPKICSYGGSESNEEDDISPAQLKATGLSSHGISQINLGYAYIPHTLDALNIEDFSAKNLTEKWKGKPQWTKTKNQQSHSNNTDHS